MGKAGWLWPYPLFLCRTFYLDMESLIMSEIVKPRVYGVTELNYYLREYISEDVFLSHLAIRGEISGFKAHSSGHIFFTLKEGECSLKVVMFRRYAGELGFLPADGDQVVVIGSVALYERDGCCQLYAQTLFPEGEGGAAKDLAQLRRKLEEEGLFSPERKKSLPRYVFDLGVITSAQGAAWADIQRIAYSRNPGIKLTLYSAAVQGINAPGQLAAALAQADKGGHDALLIGRGGGANEDLAAFDNELVVRAVAACKTPVVSAVGHESDFSLCDLAADIRAATPTHGAVIAVSARDEIEEYLNDMQSALNDAAAAYLIAAEERLSRLDLSKAVADRLFQQDQYLALLAARLKALDPLAVLGRGYAVALDEAGAAVTDAAAVQPGDILTVYPARGKITVQVTQTGKENFYG